MENVTSLSLFGVSQAAGSGARIKNRAGFPAPIPEGKRGTRVGRGACPRLQSRWWSQGLNPELSPTTIARRTAECKRGRAEPMEEGFAS